jgi:hypothetical protein
VAAAFRLRFVQFERQRAVRLRQRHHRFMLPAKAFREGFRLSPTSSSRWAWRNASETASKTAIRVNWCATAGCSANHQRGRSQPIAGASAFYFGHTPLEQPLNAANQHYTAGPGETRRKPHQKQLSA